MEDINCDNYTLPGVLQFLSTKFHEYIDYFLKFTYRFDIERLRWNQEKEELLRRISVLESEKTV